MPAKPSARELLTQIASREQGFTHAVWIVWMTCLLCMGSAWAAPVVSNVTAAQRAGTKLVDISYDVSADGFATVAIRVEASSDGGATWTVPVQTLSGDVGMIVTVGGGKTAVWDAAADWAGQSSSQMRFRVTADDGFALIPAGVFTMVLRPPLGLDR